jgi:hypothetical protein
MYLWSTNLCTLLGAITWCLHCYSFFRSGKCSIVSQMTTSTHTLFNSLFTYHSTIQCYISNCHILPTFFENESNTVLLTIQLYHNCSNPLHEIKIDRCFKHCWGVCTCMQTHTRTHFPNKKWRTKVICQNVNLQYVKLKLKFLAFFALD